MPEIRALFAAGLAVGLAAVALAATPEATSPHGRPDACTACHEAGPTPDAPGPALPIVKTCRSCHPTADMHPVGMEPVHIRVHEGWPLENGRVTCATCHAEPAHGVTTPAPWHRGGPYARVTDLCYSCHVRDDYTRSDPHRPVAPRDPADPSCAACHSGIPQTGAPVAEARLRFASNEACATCHAGAVHAGAAEHLGARVPEPPPGLALLDGDKIACFTCHEVHDGVAAAAPTAFGRAFRDRALGKDWADLADPALVWPGTDGADARLAMPGDELCRACHREGGP